jgi:Fur family transcriptional regulator, iron response regulator
LLGGRPKTRGFLKMVDFDEALIARLRKAGLRPTRQRRELAGLLFTENNQTVTAEGLHADAAHHGIKVSLATVYGTLHSFRDAGLVREVSVDAKHYFDTNPENRQYFYYEEERKLVSVSDAETGYKDSPLPPAGRSVSRVDVVVRLRRS